MPRTWTGMVMGSLLLSFICDNIDWSLLKIKSFDIRILNKVFTNASNRK